MSILVRRINRAKWNQVDIVSDDSSADAITSCLKTTNNDLSTWLIEDENDLNTAILALITGSRQENLSTIHIIYFDESLISDKNLNLSITEGDTLIDTFKNKHRDISELTYSSLGEVKDIVLDCLRNDRFKTITRSKLKTLLKDCIKEELLEKSSLSDSIQKIL
ncbi:hypothetical protein [Tenacibaculum finnmarkense]|uniref:hypothetical protein n=1 Tax=Tenacibaculum finnmarkense TaxID=2781243 RepID=UPI001EFA5C4F|nr:hypothetical protein [Tenacibaculum finnmarkense]MCG8776512.1 hypothetical protein [Tenacibaculum finnmarkense]